MKPLEQACLTLTTYMNTYALTAEQAIDAIVLDLRNHLSTIRKAVHDAIPQEGVHVVDYSPRECRITPSSLHHPRQPRKGA